MQAGPSRLPREVVPTSDDEDLFFVSQSSDRYGYTSNDDPTLEDERLARVAAAQPPTPPQRQLRARKAAQLNPYTMEAMRYQRALIRNDWQDAVVSQREWHRQERKRLAEEAARARREVQGAQGSEESQSQWLVPSSGPSSQADHEDPSAPPSPSVPPMPEVFVEIPALDEIARPRRMSPSPSQSGRLPELAEMLGQASKNAALLPNRKTTEASKSATYKGTRTIARNDDTNKAVRPHDSGSLRIDEDDAAPIPAHTRRKPTLRDTSPTDSEANIAAGGRNSTTHESFIVESSEDERPQPVPAVPRPKRRSRWSGDGSSSDSTDYERRFRQLKRMMPAGMARKHIRDLRAMRHGKAYHSDGHVSSSSSTKGQVDTARRDESRTQARSANAVQISDDEDLQPGQTRKRLRRHDSLDGGNNALLLDPDSDSSSSSSSASSLSSGPSTEFPITGTTLSNGDRGVEELDETPAPWWSVDRFDSYVPYRERDAIDRMLSRAGGRQQSSKMTSRRAHDVSQHRQARLDGFVSTVRHRERATGISRSHLREIDQNQHRRQGSTIHVSDKDAQHHLSKRKKKRRKMDPRVGRTTTGSGTARSSVLPLNPPVIRPRARPRLDLEDHDVLFAFHPASARCATTYANPDQAGHHEHERDDDEEWQVLSHVIRDSTPDPLPDARLAVPRNRNGANTIARARQAPFLSATLEAVASPIRGLGASPSTSLASAGLLKDGAVSDRSPGTPTRPRFELPSHNAAPIRSNPVQNSNIASLSADDDCPSGAWDDFEGISLNFGISPLAGGKRLNVTDSALLARLPDLILLPDRLLRQENIPRTWLSEVLRLEDTILEADMDHNTLASKLPFFIDNLRLEIGRALDGGGNASDIDARRHARSLISDTGAFLGCWMVRQAQKAAEGCCDFASIFRSYRTILERAEQLQASVLSQSDSTHSKASGEDRKLICLQLAWMRFELCWRAMAICDADASNALESDAPTVESLLSYGRTLMALLLHYGLHRSIRNLRKAASTGRSTANGSTLAMEVDQYEETTVTVDEPTTIWLAAIHLFSSFEQSRGITDGRLFWMQFEAAFQRWDESMPKRAPLLRSESLWYCLFALETMSQISADGQTQSGPSLRECWPLVARALSFVDFRLDESKEMTMGWHLLAKRDAYVRIVLQRCCLLTSEWHWRMEGAEVTLARLFDIFNSHKLADLPTETAHNFPVFLRYFDVDRLSTADVAGAEAMQDPSFHLFVRLLVRAGQELRNNAIDAKDGDRRISRLFSRMTPVRVMPFTRNDVPTNSQRSVLFNHYTVVMLFLHLVPTSSPQRLRQIQSFLPAFKDADFISQVTCVRAMMYVAVIFRHHQLGLDSVIKWFGETITALRREYEHIESSTKQFERQQLRQSMQHASRPDAVRMADIFENAPARQAALRRKEEMAKLLVVSLRSIQHVIRHQDLYGDKHSTRMSEQRLPDQPLLSPAWTQEMLEAQISLEPRIGQEALKCIQTFLLARMRALQPARKATGSSSTDHDESNQPQLAIGQQQQNKDQRRDEESQDSFAELFDADDDFDFEDPLLARLLDGADTNNAGVSGRGELEMQAKEALVAVSTAADVVEKKKWDRQFGELVKTTISPSLFQLLSNIYHPDRRLEAATAGSVVMSLGVTQRLDELPAGGGDAGRSSTSSRSRMDRLLKTAEARQYLELVVDCWAGCAHVLVTNGLREWSSYLGYGNESWKRIDDAIGRRDVALRFLQNVVSLDPTAVQRREYEVDFLAVWTQTAVARVLSVQDVYTQSLMDAIDKTKVAPSTLLSSLAERWRSIISGTAPATAIDTAGMDSRLEPTEPVSSNFDLDSFTRHRSDLLRTTYSVLASALSNNTTSTGTVYSILSALLSAVRTYVDDTPVDDGSKSGKMAAAGYLTFCKGTLEDVEAIMAGTRVMDSMRGEYGAAVAAVKTRLEELNETGIL
ncbi:hypothetical protein PHSY_006165 [Pseudozyma hubeiensis SY62]|uniref:Uncharacterized protein n=1 Tax=Pseudozyma hubeiensis (strain SY62) TaxID=1305764 RepID=R9PB17_PSEHS|nr:hypothetical protein PHSY_006165 [Pseudozyma hubeiensis SY62]GAC98571.1 hypothetical protein PHSY_006165 [Pseudozyma hubeiensis SY62]